MEPSPLPTISRVLWVSHSPSASRRSDTQGCDPPARGAARPELCVDQFPTRGLLPRRATHRRAATASPRSPQRPRPRPLPPPRPRPAPPPGPGGPLCLWGLSASSPPPPRGATGLPRSPQSAATSGDDGSPSPPPNHPHLSLPQLGTPAAHAARGHATDTVPARASGLTGVAIPCGPRRQLTSKCGGTRTPPGGRADAGPVVAVAAQRRLSLGPPPHHHHLAPSAPRGPPAASRVLEPPAQHGSRAVESHGRPSSPRSWSPGPNGATRGDAGCKGERSRRSRSSACASLSLARRRLRLDASACSPERAREEKKKTFIETIQPAAAAKSDRLRVLPHPRLHGSPGAARPLPAAAGRGGAYLGRGLSGAGRGLGGAGLSQETRAASLASNTTGGQDTLSVDRSIPCAGPQLVARRRTAYTSPSQQQNSGLKCFQSLLDTGCLPHGTDLISCES